MPRARARLIGLFCQLRLLFLAPLPVRNDIGPAQPAREIHIGAATRAERAVFCVGGAAADRTLAARDRGGIGLLHANSLHGPVPARYPARPNAARLRWDRRGTGSPQETRRQEPLATA